MKLFFYTRAAAPPPNAGRYLVAGVVEAADADAARASLNAAFAKANSADRANDFSWCDLATVERTGNGLLAICMASTD